ncbi:putative neuraminidase [Deinobacterium chartae]|uniref:Putative neuraminidase n=1 Tax=Deinobacterium chartae TaxID=521158 RepID=A0A841HX52_9DEIO|nr:sialidase family protein [Deinobacterium chartae]MBB6096780.1 putative neuraminidase [Deinobacterium chartae]
MSAPLPQPRLEASWPAAVDRVTPFCHGSSVLPLPGGDVLAAWFGGSWEARTDTGIYLARLVSGQASWSAPEQVVAPQGHAHGNAVLALHPDGTVYLFYFRSYGSWCDDGRSFYRTSSDLGRSWSAECALGGPAGLLVKNKPCVLGGRFLLPVYDEVHWRCGLAIGDRHGWTVHTDIGAPDLEVIQGAVVQAADASLHLLMRSRSGAVCDSVSTDGGHRWSEAFALEVPNPNSGLDAVSLPGGRFLMVHNPAREVIFDILDPTARDGRYPLVVSRSDDGGKSWHTVCTLEEGPGEFSYPAAALGPDGALHITYTYQRRGIRYVRIPDPTLL